MATLTKPCRTCGEDKSLDEYRLHKIGPGGRRPSCKICDRAMDKRRYWADRDVTRDRTLRWKYGLRLADYRAMAAAQDYRCGICRKEAPEGGPEFWLHVDHCHETGAVRGLLCQGCNQGIGVIPNADHLRTAASYLEKGGLSWPR